MTADFVREREAIWIAIRAAQGIAIATQDIVRVLIVDIARQHPNPEHYLSDLYGRVVQQLEPKDSDLQKGERKVYGEARDLVGDIFGAALKRLQNPPASGQV